MLETIGFTHRVTIEMVNVVCSKLCNVASYNVAQFDDATLANCGDNPSIIVGM